MGDFTDIVKDIFADFIPDDKTTITKDQVNKIISQNKQLRQENEALKNKNAEMLSSMQTMNNYLHDNAKDYEKLEQENERLREYVQHHNCCDKIHVSDEGIISPIYENKCTCGLESALNKTGD